MKKIIILGSMFLFCNLAIAAKPGPYLGGKLGYAVVDANDPFGGFNFNFGGFGGGIFAGYNFNRYLGLEGGYTLYPNTSFEHGSWWPTGSTGKLNYKMNAISLVGKVYLPLIDNNFNLYALGGAALVTATATYDSYSHSSYDVYPDGYSQTNRRVRPEVGFGASYQINNSVATNLEYTHIQGTGNKNNINSIVNADMLALGLTFNIG